MMDCTFEPWAKVNWVALAGHFFTTVGSTADIHLHSDDLKSFLDEPQDSKDSSHDTLCSRHSKETELGTEAKPNHRLSKNCQRCTLYRQPKAKTFRCDSLFGPQWEKAFMSSLTWVTSLQAADLQGQIKMEEELGTDRRWVSYIIKCIWLACTWGQCNQCFILWLKKRILTVT